MSQPMPEDFLPVPQFLKVIVAFTVVIFIERRVKAISYCLCILSDKFVVSEHY